MTSVPVQGAQVVSRAAALLRIVGQKPEGSPLVELVRDSGLTRPTVHRLLSSLAAEGLLDQDPGSGRPAGRAAGRHDARRRRFRTQRDPR